MTCTVRACVISATQRIPLGPVLRPSWTVRERLTRGETTALLTVKFCQPSHEFTFDVGMGFISYPLVLTPLV
jgi:hypothetical protein